MLNLLHMGVFDSASTQFLCLNHQLSSRSRYRGSLELNVSFDRSHPRRDRGGIRNLGGIKEMTHRA